MRNDCTLYPRSYFGSKLQSDGEQASGSQNEQRLEGVRYYLLGHYDARCAG